MMWNPVPVPGDSNTYFLKSFSGNYFLKGASLNTSYATMETDSTSAGTKWIRYDITGSLPDSATLTPFIITPLALKNCFNYGGLKKLLRKFIEAMKFYKSLGL